MKKLLSAGIIALSFLSTSVMSEQLFSVSTSGMVFKDTINVEVFDDPTISGVSCYIALPDKAFSFEDQTDTSLACRQVGPIDTKELRSQNDIFSRSKGIFFKAMRVDRFYDQKRQVLVYLSYTKKMSGDNASSSISVVSLHK